MKSSNPTLLVFVAVLLSFGAVGFATKAEAQTLNPYAQAAEAEAKLVAARAAMVTAVGSAIKAGADANKANAEALKTFEEARSLSLDNSLKKAQTFYGKRVLHDNHRNLQESQPRPAQEDLLRYSQMSAPERLTKEQLNPVRGEIHWPPVLQKDEFLLHRIQLEALFDKRLDHDQDAQEQVRDITAQMYAELRSLVQRVPPADYMRARKFIRSLAHESQFGSQSSERIGNIAVR